MTIDYITNDEIYHYGIPGMKWGVRRELSAQRSEQRAAKAKTGFMKRYHTINAMNKRYMIDRSDRIRNAKSLGDKYSNAYGYKDLAARARYSADLNSKIGKTFNSDKKRTRYKNAVYNNKQLEKYANSMSKASTGSKIVERLTQSKLMNMPIKSAAGRPSTLGKEQVLAMFTYGVGNKVADAAYRRKNRK